MKSSRKTEDEKLTFFLRARKKGPVTGYMGTMISMAGLHCILLALRARAPLRPVRISSRAHMRPLGVSPKAKDILVATTRRETRPSVVHVANAKPKIIPLPGCLRLCSCCFRRKRREETRSPANYHPGSSAINFID